MTQATFTQNPGELEVRITGHAGYAPGGKDIVCAACSTLAWVFLRLFCRLEEAGGCALRVRAYRPGEVRFAARAAPGREGEFERLAGGMAEGFAALAEQYPGFCRVERAPAKREEAPRIFPKNRNEPVELRLNGEIAAGL